MLARERHEGAAGADQAFLVGERDVAAGADRRSRRPQARRADDRREHDVDRLGGRLLHRRGAGGGRDAGAEQRVPQRRQPASSATTARRAPSLRAVSASLAPFESRGDRVHLEAVRDRPRSRRLRSSPTEPVAPSSVTRWLTTRSPAMGDDAARQRQQVTPPRPSAGDQPGERGRAEEPVHPVEHAAMAGNDRGPNPSRRTAA